MVKTTFMVSAIQELRETMARLRAPGGCPWDQEQTHQSLCVTLIEETAELLDTIDREDMEHMREELGDVLLQVIFHAQMAEEAGHFNFDDVAREINEKLVRRHPHVFGDLNLENSEAVLTQWEEIKASEKKNGPDKRGVFKHLPRALPALLHAHDVYKQIDKDGIQHEVIPDREGIEALAEDLDEVAAGELLFQIAAASRLAGIDPESALRRYSESLVQQIEDAES